MFEYVGDFGPCAVGVGAPLGLQQLGLQRDTGGSDGVEKLFAQRLASELHGRAAGGDDLEVDLGTDGFEDCPDGRFLVVSDPAPLHEHDLPHEHSPSDGLRL